MISADSSSFYQASGRFPLHATARFILASLVAIPFGWLYAWLTFHIPFIYLNFFITLGFAVVLSLAACLAAEYGKSRNPFLSGLFGLTIGILGWYCQWAAWSGMVAGTFSEKGAAGMVDFALHPAQMLALAQTVHGVGLWKIKGATVNGFWLLLAWGIEWAMIALLPLWLARSQSGEPFCEETGSWAQKIELPRRVVSIADPQKFMQALQSDSSFLANLLESAAPDAADYAKLTLYRCPDGHDSYVSAHNVNVSIKDGKEKTATSTLFEYLRINAASASRLEQELGSAASEAMQAAA